MQARWPSTFKYIDAAQPCKLSMSLKRERMLLRRQGRWATAHHLACSLNAFFGVCHSSPTLSQLLERSAILPCLSQPCTANFMGGILHE